MITLLLGTDAIAKQKYLEMIAKQEDLEILMCTEPEQSQKLADLLAPALFGKAKIVVLKNLWSVLELDKILTLSEQLSNSKLMIDEQSLDQRKTTTKTFQSDARVVVQKFEAPIGLAQSIEWVKAYCQDKEIKINSQAITELVNRLLANERSAINTTLLVNELEKLKTYSYPNQISVEAVQKLIQPKVEVDVFALLNAIAKKNKSVAMTLLEQFYANSQNDTKTDTIKLSALLADQFRSLLVVLDSTARHLPEAEVLKLTGWNSKRLFVLKQLSKNFHTAQVVKTLSKLSSLDSELKTGDLPPQVVLDLIIADM